ncbi:MAG: chemotaxis protein CheC [Myxococcota bacterium]|jgi:chemotaxis protein CheC
MATKDSDTDRLRELTSVGAGHAASAFSQLTGRTIEMRTPELIHDPKWPANVAGDWASGVLFEFEGCLEAVVAILFRARVRDIVARQMLSESAELTRDSIEAVIMELGNILVSRVASAVADTLGQRLLPSIPVLAFDDAADQLTALCAARGLDPSVRVECEFADREAELGGLLVLIPARVQPQTSP